MVINTNIFERVRNLNFPLGYYVVVGGGCLEAHGIRITSDVDIVVRPHFFEELIEKGWTLDSEYERKWSQRRLIRKDVEVHDRMMFLNKDGTFLDVKDIIASADVIYGIPFQTLQSLLVCKRNALRHKDAKDVVLIEQYLKINR